MRRFLCIGFLLGGPAAGAWAADAAAAFPLPLDAYGDEAVKGTWAILLGRIQADPFNLVAAVIFLLAIIHTFFAAKIRHWAHAVEARQAARRAPARAAEVAEGEDTPVEVSFGGQVLHFLGEVEAVFGIWAVVLMIAITWSKGWGVAEAYVGEQVDYTEAVFVVIIMAIAATRPVVKLATDGLRAVARLGRGTPAAWWLAILIIAPMLGSLITEPAAITIAALLLARQFYELKPGPRLKYATLGLLFVNISVGGTFTHFAAPPVLMVAAPWKWGLAFMFEHFGWKAGIGIVVSTGLYYAVFRREFAALAAKARPAGAAAGAAGRAGAVPAWITAVHLAFMAFTVWQAHHPVLFIGGFLFFVAFTQATAHHQDKLELRSPLLVGFFLAGLVIHGGLQGWWIEPVLKGLGEVKLMLGATFLTAFNDNAAITYLATLVPEFTEALKYAVVAGAVTGGGLTVIANAPNPAGQSILSRYFPEGVSPLGLFLGAAVPTLIMGLCFMLL